jgi:uncharacterized UPF0160 family protein
MSKITIVTHSGGFHADDVFAVATILLTLPSTEEISVIRSREKEVADSADYVVDVGGEYEPKRQRFDHHQEGGAGHHLNGIPYASFGLVWKEYGEKISGSSEISFGIEEKLVMFVDALDNGVNISEPIYEGVRQYTISDYLYSYWIDEHVTEEEIDEIFLKVVYMSRDLIVREIDKAKRIIEESLVVEEIYNKTEDKRFIILDTNLAWGKILVSKPEPLVVVYPSIDGLRWNAKVVRISLTSFDCRAYFPESWSGKIGEELAKLSGVSDAEFCHNARFLASAKTKEGAIKLAQQVEKFN